MKEDQAKWSSAAWLDVETGDVTTAMLQGGDRPFPSSAVDNVEGGAGEGTEVPDISPSTHWRWWGRGELQLTPGGRPAGGVVGPQCGLTTIRTIMGG